ncbi:LRR domain containing protein [Trema orientale]|uniref:LRR domain containing protein n=1 Tax=Trema orientale TaxID=63057 RepID=A0A2P5BRC5_TREOI|nr:LRR domain containing protein [Trema orientale]
MGLSFWLWFVFLLFDSQVNSSLSLSSLSFPLCHLDESIALLQFKNSFFVSFSTSDDDCYDKTNSWENGTNCCMWSGVTCDKSTGHVISLNVHCSGLQGILNSNNSLFSLSHLRTLVLSDNSFYGSPISSKFGKFTHLTHLELSNSGFSGHVPLEVAHLSNLITLRLSSSDVKLEMPTLKGIIQNLTHLRELDLTYNDMSSILPVSFMNLSSSMTSLNLSNTKLHGKLPENIFITAKPPRTLFGLDLSESGFSIDLAFVTRNLKNLNSLFLSVCKFVGSYPTLVGNFTEIIELDLSYNNFSGQVPWSALNFKQITSLDLSGNNFEGELPKYYGNSKENSSLEDSSESQSIKYAPLHLKFLFLFENKLSGTLPPWLHMIPSLQHLDIHGNKFSGFVNEFQTRSLEDLSNNQIQGKVPKWLRSMGTDSLYFIDLSHNFLTNIEQVPWKNLRYLFLHSNLLQGPLPVPPPFSVVFKISNNKLSGELPSLICMLKEVEILDLSYNNLSGMFPPCIDQGGMLAQLPGMEGEDAEIDSFSYSKSNIEDTNPAEE